LKKDLILFRGLPGSGKSTLASLLCDVHFSADMFFEKDGEYKFDITKISDAHEYCRSKVEEAMSQNVGVIGIANTFTMDWEMDSYFLLAEFFGYRVHTIIIENRHGSDNIHGCPEETIQRMKDRFSIKL
jgi:predicted kinase